MLKLVSKCQNCLVPHFISKYLEARRTKNLPDRAFISPDSEGDIKNYRENQPISKSVSKDKYRWEINQLWSLSKRENPIISYYFLLFWFHQNLISSTKYPPIMHEWMHALWKVYNEGLYRKQGCMKSPFLRPLEVSQPHFEARKWKLIPESFSNNSRRDITCKI